MNKFNDLGMNLGNLPRLSNAKTGSITCENFTGEKGKGYYVGMYRWHIMDPIQFEKDLRNSINYCFLAFRNFRMESGALHMGYI